MASDEEGSICEFVIAEKNQQLVLVEVQVGIGQTAEIPVNDRCRLCNRILRVNGIIRNSVLLFVSKPPQKRLSDKLAALGLVLKPDKNRSMRACTSCENTVRRLERDMAVLRKWKEENQGEGADSPEASPGAPGDKRARSPSPSDSRPEKRLRKIPPERERRSVTQVITTYTSKTVVKKASCSEAGIINHIVNRNWKTAANQLSTHKDLFQELQSNFLTFIDAQCRRLVKPKSGFILWKSSPDDLKCFSFDNLIADLERMSPFLLSMFCTISNDNQDAACAALCIALRGRAPQMSAFAYHVNGIVSRGGLKKAMLNRLSKMSITTTYSQARMRHAPKGTSRGVAKEAAAEREPSSELIKNSDQEKSDFKGDSEQLGNGETHVDNQKS